MTGPRVVIDLAGGHRAEGTLEQKGSTVSYQDNWSRMQMEFTGELICGPHDATGNHVPAGPELHGRRG